jgi:hypothetical protein
MGLFLAYHNSRTRIASFYGQFYPGSSFIRTRSFYKRLNKSIPVLNEPFVQFVKRLEGASSVPNNVGMRKVGIGYVYDMGSSTDLEIQVVAKIDACQQKKVMILMQNEPPALSCESCKKAASVICSQCGDSTCSPSSKKHTCVVDEGDDYMLMPLVNSPRAGVCGYEGP